jgi:hypothetical protein
MVLSNLAALVDLADYAPAFICELTAIIWLLVKGVRL